MQLKIALLFGVFAASAISWFQFESPVAGSVVESNAIDDSTDWKPASGPLATKWTSGVTPENAHREYPRPQMVRDHWTNLNGLWEYAITPKEADRPDKFDGQILVPFPIESALSGVMKRV